MSFLDDSASSGASTLNPIENSIANPFKQGVSKKGLLPGDFPDGFCIQEFINGTPGTDAQNFIQLVGNLMPMQPFPWSMEQRLVKEYYPGNREPSVQVMGPKDGPLTIKGKFKDKRYKNPDLYGAAYQFSLAVQEMVERGNLVYFGMNADAGDWFRYGFIEKADFKMNKLSWVEYEITFFVVSESQPINDYFSAPEKQAPSAVNQLLLNAATDFQNTYGTVPASMPLSIAGAINNFISGIAKNINLVTGFVNNIVNTAQSIEASANRALGLIKNMRAYISSTMRAIDNIEHGFTALSSQGSAPGKTRDTYQNISYITETMIATRQMSLYLAQMQTQFEALAQSVPKARYRVQVGNTLQNISIKFYGVSDNWIDIYQHNNLTSATLVPGTILEIPKL